MAHVRTQIRNAVVAALTGLPATGSRVYSGRTRSLAKGHDPTILVYATEESSDVDSMGSAAKLVRTMTLAIEGRVSTTGATAAEDLEDTLDQVALEVEEVMARPPCQGMVIEITLTATRITAQSPGESHAGEVRMDYRVLYRTRENAPATAV